MTKHFTLGNIVFISLSVSIIITFLIIVLSQFNSKKQKMIIEYKHKEIGYIYCDSVIQNDSMCLVYNDSSIIKITRLK